MPFVGRAAELEALSAQYDRAKLGMARTILIGGEAGIGKTRLVEYFLAHTSDRQPVSLWGSTPVPAAEQIPYAPVLDILRAVEREHSEILEAMGSARDDLSPILPRSAASAASVSASSDATFARVRMLGALRLLFERLAATSPPLVVVFDDLQWADDGTLDALSLLVRQLRDAPILLIGTYRSDALSARPALERLLVELVRLEQVTHLSLGGLPEAELIELAPEPIDERRARTFAARAAGNPYYFGELASAGRETDQLPGNLRDFLLQRVKALPAAARVVVQVAAIAGDLATSRLIERVLVAAQHDVAPVLRVLLQSGALQAPRDGRPAYGFPNALLQEAVLDDMLPGERSAMHRAVALALDADPSLRTPGPAGVVESALHWAAADDAVAARPALLAGARVAAGQYAFELAYTLLERVLGAGLPTGAPPHTLGFQPPTTTDGDASNDLVLRTAEMAYLAGRSERAIELARNSLVGLTDARRALVLERIASYELAANNVQAALTTLSEAVASSAAAGEAERARIHASRGRALMLAARYAEARGELVAAIELAQSAHAVEDEGRALRTLASVLVRMGDAPAAVEKLDAARLIDEQRGQSLILPRPSRIGYLIGGLVDQAVDMRRDGSADGAMSAANVAADAAKRLGGRAAWGGMVTATALEELFLLGRWAEAAEILAAGDAEMAPDPPDLAVARARLQTARGEIEEAATIVERSLDGSRGSPASTAALLGLLAEIAIWQNHPDEARVAIDEALDAMSGGEDAIAIAEAVALGLRADAQRADLARARHAADEVAAIGEDAVLLSARLDARAVSDGAPGKGRLAAIQMRCAAELREVNGSDAADAWMTTADAFERLREPYNAAVARWREAEDLLERRQDRPRADEALRQAHAVADRLGARSLTHEIDELARRARVDLEPGAKSTAQPQPESRVQALKRELGLSTREIEVLSLVALGRTNRQIADELFITEKTAGHHVSNILTKLTLSSRVEAAAVAHRSGLLAAMESEQATA